jgi:hypothetical protein
VAISLATGKNIDSDAGHFSLYVFESASQAATLWRWLVAHKSVRVSIDANVGIGEAGIRMLYSRTGYSRYRLSHLGLAFPKVTVTGNRHLVKQLCDPPYFTTQLTAISPPIITGWCSM